MSNTRIIRQIVDAAAEAARGPVKLDAAGVGGLSAGFLAPQDLSREVTGRTTHSFALGFDRFDDTDAVFE